jgi:SAM-dependent methyltransferase
MFKYVLAAAALKAFSSSDVGRRLYRALGNTVGARGRVRRGLNPQYLQRAKYLVALCDKHAVPRPGARTLEVGSGWVHWESTVLRLFYDVRPTAFDVWDNRQFSAFQRYLSDFGSAVDRDFGDFPERAKRVQALLAALTQTMSFEEAYQVLGLTYLIDREGTLRALDDHSFNMVVSWDVLEHVDRAIAPKLIKDIFRVLEPGGYSFHQIDMRDHLTYYDPMVSHKNYLRYSHRAWKSRYENKVQYINRVQRPEWLALFEEAGLELVESESDYIDIGTTKVDRSYSSLDQQDLSCVALRLLHRKPH